MAYTGRVSNGTKRIEQPADPMVGGVSTSLAM
jgi:hypothetical protein